jgi:hypothetical protein
MPHGARQRQRRRRLLVVGDGGPTRGQGARAQQALQPAAEQLLLGRHFHLAPVGTRA